MRIEFLKWGNNLALRVPKAFAQEIGAAVGKAANMEVRDGKLVTAPAPIHLGAPGCRHKSRDPPASSNGGRRLATKSGDYCPDAGDLVWIDLSPTLDHEQSGHRLAPVLTPRQYNVRSGLCMICPITSRARGYPFEVAIPDGHIVSGAAKMRHPATSRS
jgi:mRNA interferase MazF